MNIPFSQIERGDFVNLRAVATHRDGDVLTVRVAGAHSVHQFNVRSAGILDARKCDANAPVDELCAGYDQRVK